MMEEKKQPIRSRVAALVDATAPSAGAFVLGWVRTVREHGELAFLELNDGSCLQNLQVVATAGTEARAQMMRLSTGASVSVTGDLVRSPGAGQKWELAARDIRQIGASLPEYPLQKKRHSDEFLRTIAHLRPRTNKYGAIFRIRSRLSAAIHQFFQEKGFCYVHTPIITSSDCEGAGDLFRVRAGAEKEEFFGKPAFLTVSGQLAGEMFACALGDIYTFGPTFRAENSHTARHAAEFWMVEPEMAFCTPEQNQAMAEEFIRFLVCFALEKCAKDLELFYRFVDKNLEPMLQNIASQAFERISYTKAVAILQKAKKPFQYEAAYGQDLQTEHERYLTEEHCKKPVIVYDYPASLKPFYMRQNDDGQTVAAMDVLVPRVGEIIGGSAREERQDRLEACIAALGLAPADYWWYLDSRRFGTVPHAGFGMGFERLLMMVTGVSNIRDVIPFPRTPGAIEF